MLTIEQKNNLNQAILNDPRNRNLALISPVKVCNKLSEMRTKKDAEVLTYIDEVNALLVKPKREAPTSPISFKDIINKLKIKL